MNPRIVLATVRRILQQLRHDRRSVAMMILVPSILMVLLRYVLNSQVIFDHTAPTLLGIFPFSTMFIITSVTMLRERTTSTLERLLTMPTNKIDLLLGYALAFGLMALLQVGLVSLLSLTWLGLQLSGATWLLFVVAVLDALLGMALGLFVSAFARSEFQAVQFMPVIVMPQILLCGLFAPRNAMIQVLSWLSDAMPLAYAVEALQKATSASPFDLTGVRDLLIVAACIAAVLLLGAATLRRRTA